MQFWQELEDTVETLFNGSIRLNTTTDYGHGLLRHRATSAGLLGGTKIGYAKAGIATYNWDGSGASNAPAQGSLSPLTVDGHL
jgi:hypothetical protein